jgi:CHAD domain-containing protein
VKENQLRKEKIEIKEKKGKKVRSKNLVIENPCFFFSSKVSVAALLSLPPPFKYRGGETTRQGGTLYDTFDWRLYKKGYALLFNGSQLSLLNHKLQTKGSPISSDREPRFSADLPEYLFAELAPLINVRALLPLATFELDYSIGRIVDDEIKTHVWLDVSTDKEGNFIISSRSLSGYQASFEMVNLLLASSGPRTITPLEQLYRAAGRVPLDYSGKLNLQLKAQTSAGEAARDIYLNLLTTIRQNTQGIYEDVDSEFLHDFRVAVRRTRSALSLIKGVFPIEFTQRAKQDFRTLSHWTNSLRDLDVYLLAHDHYITLVPTAMAPDLQWFFAQLRQNRLEALEELKERLDSKVFVQIIDRWHQQLEGQLPQGHKAQLPIRPLASHYIYKKYQSIRCMGLALHQQSSDKDLHDMRIECKELRYLFEFFNTLYPTAKCEKLLAQLKKLQSYLGDYNDLCVQAEFISQIALELRPPAKQLRKALLALGTLVGSLNCKRQQLKKVCVEQVIVFIDDETYRSFHFFKQDKQRDIT